VKSCAADNFFARTSSDAITHSRRRPFVSGDMIYFFLVVKEPLSMTVCHQEIRDVPFSVHA
jgi:hypothetical protein